MTRRLKESAVLRAPFEKLAETEQVKAWAQIERQLSQFDGPDGLTIPVEFLIAAGTK